MRIRDVYPGSEFSIPDPNFPSRIQGQKDTGSASKNLSIFNPKNCFEALGKIIWDVHLRSRIRIPPVPKKERIPEKRKEGSGYCFKIYKIRPERDWVVKFGFVLEPWWLGPSDRLKNDFVWRFSISSSAFFDF